MSKQDDPETGVKRLWMYCGIGSSLAMISGSLGALFLWLTERGSPNLILILIVAFALFAIGLFVWVIIWARKYVLLGPKEKEAIRIAVVLNGEAEYAIRSMNGFVSNLERSLRRSRYFPLVEYATGCGNGNEEINRDAFERVMSKFAPNGPDYLVPIGTAVSEFAFQEYGANSKRRNKKDILFIAVTDPSASGFGEDNGERGSITGVAYGINVVERIQITRALFPRKRIGFVYAEGCPADLAVKKQFLDYKLDFEKEGGNPEMLQLIPLTLDGDGSPIYQFPEGTSKKIDVVLGYYSVGTHMWSFIQSSKGTPEEDLPVIGTTRRDIANGAAAAFEVNNHFAGDYAASRIMIRALSKRHEPLHLKSFAQHFPSTQQLLITRNLVRSGDVDGAAVHQYASRIIV